MRHGAPRAAPRSIVSEGFASSGFALVHQRTVSGWSVTAPRGRVSWGESPIRMVVPARSPATVSALPGNLIDAHLRISSVSLMPDQDSPSPVARFDVEAPISRQTRSREAARYAMAEREPRCGAYRRRSSPPALTPLLPPG